MEARPAPRAYDPLIRAHVVVSVDCAGISYHDRWRILAVPIPKELEKRLSVDPEVMHGKVCFKGTRVPLTVLLDNLEEGMGVTEFVCEYPSVSREQADAVIEWEQNSLRRVIGLPAAS